MCFGTRFYFCKQCVCSCANIITFNFFILCVRKLYYSVPCFFFLTNLFLFLIFQLELTFNISPMFFNVDVPVLSFHTHSFTEKTKLLPLCLGPAGPASMCIPFRLPSWGKCLGNASLIYRSCLPFPSCSACALVALLQCGKLYFNS